MSTFAATLFMTGCASIMPYDSEFSCNKGPGRGVCGSMSEVYKKTLPADDNETIGQTNIISKNKSIIAADSDDEEIMYALYRKEKAHDSKNIEQDERIAKLEMQSKLLIASNSNLTNKIADIPTSQSVQNYPIYQPSASDSKLNESPKEVIKNQVKKKPAYQKCHSGDLCKLLSRETTVNTRENPCICSDIVGYIHGDQVVKITDEKRGWVKTAHGWVDRNLLKRTSGTTVVKAKAVPEASEIKEKSTAPVVSSKTSKPDNGLQMQMTNVKVK
jgi:hypothetical protein